MAVITTKTGVKVDASGFLHHLKDYAQVMGISFGDVLKQQAGFFCEDMAKITPPNGLTKASQSQGMQNVQSSIEHVFRPLNRASKEQIADLGDEDVFKKWLRLIGKDDKTSLLSEGAKYIKWKEFEAKNKGRTDKTVAFIPSSGAVDEIGRIHSKYKQSGRNPYFYLPTGNPGFMLVERKADISTYIKQEQKRVGLLKSPWYWAAKNVKSSPRIPTWAQNPEGSAQAIFINAIKGEVPELTIGSSTGRKLPFVGKFVKTVLNDRAHAMRNAMKQKMNKDGSALWVMSATGKLGGTYQYFNQ